MPAPLAADDTGMSFPFLPEVLSGDTADVYFPRVAAVLQELDRDPHVGMEIFCAAGGVLCGVTQVAQLLRDTGFTGELRVRAEGDILDPGEAAIQIIGRYSEFGRLETAIIGTLASCTGWATAAREVVTAAGTTPVISFGARHVHPNVSGVMDYAAIIGGCIACSTSLGSALSGTEPSGTMPHAYLLIVGDTLEAAQAFDRYAPEEVPRIVLVDTFQDEAVEALRVATAMGLRLQGIRVDTPSERGGVTPGLVKELRARLDMSGFSEVQIVVSGGITPERIARFVEGGAAVDAYGVGSFISGAHPIDFTADIRQIDGHAVAKRGRIPGMQADSRLTAVT